MNNIDEITAYARKARIVLEAYAATNPHGIFANFPNSSCRDSAYFIRKFSVGKGINGLSLVSATSTDELGRSTHAWLELDGNIIDITADQFNERLPDNMPSVYVSTDRIWHDRYFPEQTLETDRIFLDGFNNFFRETKSLMDTLLAFMEQ